MKKFILTAAALSIPSKLYAASPNEFVVRFFDGLIDPLSSVLLYIFLVGAAIVLILLGVAKLDDSDSGLGSLAIKGIYDLAPFWVKILGVGMFILLILKTLRWSVG